MQNPSSCLIEIPLISLQNIQIIRMPLLHETWPSNNRFCCNCCVSGPVNQMGGIPCFFACVISIIIPFGIIILPTTWDVSPALPIFLILSIILTILFLLLTACTDPGIIPRRPYLESQRQRFKHLLTAEPKGQNKFCETCHIYRPPRSSHCSTCQNCVQVFDHHCGFIGTCIAKRNYRFFVMFLGFSSLMILMVVANTVVYIVTRQNTSHDQTALIILVSIFGVLLGLPLMIFLGFHILLSCTGSTTRQLIKHYDHTQMQNQWCDVAEPLFDPFKQISVQDREYIISRIEQMRRPMPTIVSNIEQPEQKQYIQQVRR